MDKEYYIKLNGKRISVTEEVYYAFKRPVWKEIKSRRIRNKNELSLDWLAENGFEISLDEKPIDEIVEDKLMLDMLFEALSELTDDERYLINELFFNNKSEREFASETNVTQQTIHKKKLRIVNKIKKLMNL